MVILNDVECVEWLTRRNVDFKDADRSQGSDGFVSLPEVGYGAEFEVPADAWTQLMLAHSLSKLPEGRDVFLWVTSWALYSEKEREVFDSFRQSHGEHRWLIDAPGHLLDLSGSGERWILAEILLFMMAFNWEGFVIQGNKETIIWMADEIIEIVAQKSDANEFSRKIIHDLDLKVVDHQSSANHERRYKP